MNRTKKKSPAQTPQEHTETIGELLTQLRKHLAKSAGQKGTYSDYLRLLEFYSQSNPTQPRKLIVGWVDDPDLLRDPAA